MKNSIKAINVKIGWKNRPGNSARHFALSLNNAAIKSIRLRNMDARSNITIYEIRKKLLGRGAWRIRLYTTVINLQ